jgi:aromatic ring-opening dioxygenase catalytic subunit (LigB family)
MADIVAAMASVHLPSLLAAPQRFTPAVWEKFQQGFGTLRHTLNTSRADTLVVISDEHFNALDPRCYPTFGVVTADTCTGPVENWLGLPRGSITVQGAPALGEAILRQGARQGFDLTRLGAVALDHGFLTCLHFLTPNWDLSYLWLIQNCVLPPLPSVRRCYDFGRMVGEAIRAWESPHRVALLGTGGLSHAVGTPDMGRIDPAFDTRLLDLLCANSPALCDITDAELDAIGNGTHEIRNWVAVAGAVAGAQGEVIMYEPVPGCGSGMMQFHVAA